MKKLLAITLLTGILSSSVIAATIGKVGTVRTISTGVIKMNIIKLDDTVTNFKQIVGTVDAKKAMLALVLTAKSTGATISAETNDVDGVTGWSNIDLQ